MLNKIQSNPMLLAGVSVLKKLNDANHTALMVGGCVRDLVLGQDVHDCDICTSAEPHEVEEVFGRVYDIGASKDFGIVTINEDGFSFEIATFRTETGSINNRKPEEVTLVKDFKEDAARRDFTINSLGLDANGNIIDHFNGVAHINEEVIKAVGNPSERFEEDALRILRCVRFAAKLGFDIDPKTRDAAIRNRHLINNLSAERIQQELVKMSSLSGTKFANAILIMKDLKILGIVLPEVAHLNQFPHSPQHHPEGNVQKHVLSALCQNKIADPLINLSILFHDVGKNSSTYKLRDGKHTYYGHDNAAIPLINGICDRLKFSNDERDCFLFSAINHMKMHRATEIKPSKIAAIMNHKFFDVLKHVSFCDDASRLHLFDEERFNANMAKIEAINIKFGKSSPTSITKMINGKRIIELTSMTPSKKFSEIIKIVSEIVINSDITDQSEIDNLIVKTVNKINHNE